MTAILANLNSFVYQTGLDYRINGNEFIAYPGGFIPQNPIPSDLTLIINTFNSSSFDLLIINTDIKSPINRDSLPNGKFLLKYIDVGRFFDQFPIQKNSAGILPDFISSYRIDSPNSAGYSVKFWDSRWLELITSVIQDSIAQGYDGFFLDDITATNDWKLNNLYNNTVIDDIEIRMGELILKIRNIIDSNSKNHLLLIANNPIEVLRVSPNISKSLDAGMQESGINSGLSKFQLINNLQFYEKLNLQILGHDWFAGNIGIDTLLDDLRIYTQFPNSVFSFNTGFQGPEVLRSGPFIQTARELASSVSGFSNGINLLSTGTAKNSTLNGGIDAINYFIGSGRNCIATGGNKADYFEMHQSNQYEIGFIKIILSNSTSGILSPPKITIKINDQVAVQEKVISAVYGKSFEVVTIKIPSNSLENIKIITDGASATSRDYSCIQIEEVRVNGISIDLSDSSFTNGGLNSLGVPYSYNGTMSVKSSVLTDALLSNTSYGNVKCIGGAGIDTADYSGVNSDGVAIKVDAQGQWLIQSTLCKIDDVVKEVERLNFSNKYIAIDLNGNAGTTAKILGAIFGKESLTNKSYVGIGLHFLDAGWTYDNLAALALDAVGAKTNDQIVSLLWTNVIGTKPTAADKQPFITLLENGMSAGALAHLAADTSFNTTNINLVGLAQTGIEYNPVS